MQLPGGEEGEDVIHSMIDPFPSVFSMGLSKTLHSSTFPAAW